MKKDTNLADLSDELRSELMASMYGADKEVEASSEQPIQLRLAGKATIINVDGKQVAIPRIEYIEALEAGLRALKSENQKLRDRLAKVERMNHRDSNIANNRIRSLESDLRQELDKKLTRRDY